LRCVAAPARGDRMARTKWNEKGNFESRRLAELNDRLLLWLGAELFDLIGIDFFTRLLEHKWFAIPATSLAVAAAVHVTDVRAGLVRGARTLLLVLLSWLLPLMAIIVAGSIAVTFTMAAREYESREFQRRPAIAIEASEVLAKGGVGALRSGSGA